MNTKEGGRDDLEGLQKARDDASIAYYKARRAYTKGGNATWDALEEATIADNKVHLAYINAVAHDKDRGNGER